MIYHVNGTLDSCEMGSCVVDCSGVGYKLSISDNTYEKVISRVGELIKLYTYLQAREDGVELFGFYSKEEQDAFKLLITVSGVGPKAAMAVLSLLAPDRLFTLIMEEDIKAIAKANGVGSKTAARIVLELRDKVSKIYFGQSVKTQNPLSGSSSSTGKGHLSEALDALIVLGYSRQEAQRALAGIDPSLDVEKIIPMALAKLL